MQSINQAVETVVSQQIDSLRQITDIQEMMSGLQDAQSLALSSKSEHHNEELKQILDAVIQRVDKAMDGLGDKSVGAQQQIADTLALTTKAIQENMQQNMQHNTESMQQTMLAMQQTAQSMQTHFAALQTGLTGLNNVLEKLGQQNVVIEATIVEPKKKGWFGK